MRIAIPLILFSILSPVASVRGEINGDESVDWLVADSDLIVRGRLAEVRTRKREGQVVWQTFRVRVEQTLKGKSCDEVQFGVRHLGHERIAATAKDRKNEYLFFLVDSRRYLGDARGYGDTKLALRLRWGRHSFVRLAEKATKHGLYGMDFQVLNKRAGILAAVKSAARDQKGMKKPQEHRTDVPSSSPAYRALWAGSSVYMIMPVNKSLERHARAWTEEKDVDQRQQAVLALKHFKNKDNVKLLTRLLSDKGYWINSSAGGKTRTRIFPVRKAAFDVLTEWGERPSKPVLEERL